jgi:hypothetical protein
VQRERVESNGGRFRAILSLGLLAFLAAILGGCGPALSKSDLGTVVFEIPKVAGADKPYPMPKLGPADEKMGRQLRGRGH